jgi:hypothetical protein
MEVPVGGGEGACPFGRRTSSRAAYLFSRSVNDSEQRCKYAAKYLAYRLPSERDVEKDADAAESAIRAVEALVDVVENYAHPSNAGRWTNTLAQFLTHAVKYFRKRVAAAEAAEARGDDGSMRKERRVSQPASVARARASPTLCAASSTRACTTSWHRCGSRRRPPLATWRTSSRRPFSRW